MAVNPPVALIPTGVLARPEGERFCQSSRQRVGLAVVGLLVWNCRSFRLIGMPMDCVCRGLPAVTERSDLTARGHRRFRCQGCGKQFNERSGGVLNRTCLPSDVIAFVGFCRLRYRLTLRDLSEILLLRRYTVSLLVPQHAGGRRRFVLRLERTRVDQVAMLNEVRLCLDKAPQWRVDLEEVDVRDEAIDGGVETAR